MDRENVIPRARMAASGGDGKTLYSDDPTVSRLFIILCPGNETLKGMCMACEEGPCGTMISTRKGCVKLVR